MDYAALAKQYGAIEQQPAKPAQPDWVSGLSEKDQAELNMKLYQEGRKRLAELHGQIAQSQQTLDDLNEFGELNRRSRTGGFIDNILPGTPMLHGEDENRMQAIQSRLGPAQRPVGSGASSDTDVKLFLGGIPSITQKGNVNKGIREDFQRKFDYAVQKRNAMQQYLNKHGNLNGFDEQWEQRNAKFKKPKPAAGGVKFLGFE